MSAPAAPAPTITVGPLSAAIELPALERFIEKGKPGDSLTFAWGPVPPRSTATWVRSIAAVAAKLITVRHVRVPGGYQYVAERIAGGGDALRSPHATAAPGTATPGAADPDAAEARLLGWLRRCAAFDLPCPSNAEINAALNVRNGAYLFRKLVAAGAIRSIDPGPGHRRIVTIMASGRKTRAGRA